MRKGFKFKEFLCVNCRACVAACLLENKWETQMRSVFVYNKELNPSFPVFNLSMACNHCTHAPCLTGCPAMAIHRDKFTGAVLIENSKCIGCNYCKWNCPYGAPKTDPAVKVAEKCNLCYELVSEGRKPACASGCPTGALDYGEIADLTDNSGIEWFPDKGLDPAIEINHKRPALPIKIIPSEKFYIDSEIPISEGRDNSGDWSLVGFTFLSMLSVSLTLTDFFSGRIGDHMLNLWLIIIAGVFSLFHLGRKGRAWRAIINIFRSPLSIEITAYICYVLTMALALLYKNPWLSIAVTGIGIGFMASMDYIYIFPDKNGKNIIHSGQVFLSAMIMSSFFSHFVLPFVFLALIKALISVYFLIKRGNRHWSFGLRFIRIVLLIVSAGVIMTGAISEEKLFYLLFIAGELADRILFYVDFDPVNVNNLIYEKLIISSNEKERD